MRCAARMSRCRRAASRAVQREFTVLSETDMRTAAAIQQSRGEGGERLSGPPLRRGPAPSSARADERLNVRFNGKNAIAMGVVKQATANPLDVSNAVRGEAAAPF